MQEETNTPALPKVNLRPLDFYQQNLFQQVLQEYEDICAKSQTRIGKIHVIIHKILTGDTGDVPPITQPLYRMNPVR